ncbi:MAG TPA: hypothetical protein PKA99_04810 [Dermatophilaceae bacterium]|nr:hypothetical protein [Dermatophilaceae bacterium]
MEQTEGVCRAGETAAYPFGPCRSEAISEDQKQSRANEQWIRTPG